MRVEENRTATWWRCSEGISLGGKAHGETDPHITRQYCGAHLGYPLRDGLRAAIGEHG
jgi:hypothetical protein